MEIKQLVKEAHETALKKGFWEDSERFMVDGVMFTGECWEHKPPFFPSHGEINAICTRLMSIVGEAAEAQEALRVNDWRLFKEEIADIVIRTATLCGGLGINLEEEIEKKLEFNKQRVKKHGKLF